jgi:hypothetical protein
MYPRGLMAHAVDPVASVSIYVEQRDPPVRRAVPDSDTKRKGKA